MNAYRSPKTVCAAPVLLAESSSGRAITRWMGCLARHHARVATFGVRQPRCRSSRAHDPARGTPLTLPVTRMLYVIITFVASVSFDVSSIPATGRSQY